MRYPRSRATTRSSTSKAVTRGPEGGGLEFWGSSFVCDPQGRLLAQAPRDREDLLIVDCPLERVEEQRRAWPFLRDRRVDAYGDLLERLRR